MFYTERDSKIEISAVPKPRDSTIASHLIFLILSEEAQKKHNEGFSERILVLDGSFHYGAFPE
jgi:hypothetical protein